MQFVDRSLKCSDCGNEFVFTAGEQLFFHDKQFKNDPKRCKLCKAKRSGLGKAVGADGTVQGLPFSRTETRTECSSCGIETTVPFKPTQGRPVLCRECFQQKRLPSGVAAAVAMDSAEARVAAAAAALGLDEGREGLVERPGTMEMIAQVPAAMVHEAETGGDASAA